MISKVFLRHFKAEFNSMIFQEKYLQFPLNKQDYMNLHYISLGSTFAVIILKMVIVATSKKLLALLSQLSIESFFLYIIVPNIVFQTVFWFIAIHYSNELKGCCSPAKREPEETELGQSQNIETY